MGHRVFKILYIMKKKLIIIWIVKRCAENIKKANQNDKTALEIYEVKYLEEKNPSKHTFNV